MKNPEFLEAMGLSKGVTDFMCQRLEADIINWAEGMLFCGYKMIEVQLMCLYITHIALAALDNSDNKAATFLGITRGKDTA